MRIINREQLLKFLMENKSKEIPELAVHTFFMSHGYEHDRNLKKESNNKNEEK